MRSEAAECSTLPNAKGVRMTHPVQSENHTLGSTENTRAGPGGSSVENVKEAASSTSEKVGNTLNEAAAALKSKAREIGEPIKDHAVHVAEEQISTGAHKVEGIARAVHEAADKIQEEIPQAGTYVHHLADRLDDASRLAREQRLSDIVRAIDDFAHRQPLAFFGATILAGFALTRFMKSGHYGSPSGHSSTYDESAKWAPEYHAPEGGKLPP